MCTVLIVSFVLFCFYVRQSGYMYVCVSANNDFCIIICVCQNVCACEVDLCVEPPLSGLNYHTKLFYLHLLLLSCHSV